MVKVGRVAQLISGVGFPHGFQGGTSGDYPFLKVSDLSASANGYEISGANNWVSRDDARALGVRLAPAGSIVFPKVGAALLKNQRRLLLRSAAMDNNLMAVVPRAGDSRYWLYALSIIDLGELSGSGPLPFVNEGQVRELQITFPGEGEQRRIADFLDAEGARIGRMQRMTSRQALLLSEQLTESIRLGTTVGAGPSKDTGIPWMPNVNDSWRLLKVSHAFRTGSGTTPTSDRPEYFDGPYPWVNSADLNDSEIHASEKSVTARALSEFPALKLHPPGSLVVALYGQGTTKGKVGVLRIAACLNQACCILIPNGPILTEYAAYWFRAHKDGIVGLASGAGQPNLSQELIRQLRICVPEIAEQRSISERLQGLEKEVRRRLTLLRRRERLLAERRTALITAAVTGQIDVSTASGRGIED